MIKRIEKVIVITTINFVNIFYKISPIIQKTAQKSVLFFKKINNLKQKKYIE